MDLGEANPASNGALANGQLIQWSFRAPVLRNNKAILFKSDTIPPVISGLPPANTILWPPNKKMIQVAIITATDALSGLMSFDVTGTSNEPSNPADPDIVITGSGLGPRTVRLRADRLDSGSGRIYTLRATATDRGGNSTTAVSTVIVPHDQGR